MGANRTWGKPPIESLDRQVKKLFGRATSAGASALSATDCLGFTIARSGVGTFLITTDDSYPASEANASGVTSSPLFGCVITPVGGTPTDGNAWVSTDYSPSAKTMTVTWMVAGSAADFASGVKFMIELTFRNTGVPRKGV